jgi:hypothetical protein
MSDKKDLEQEVEVLKLYLAELLMYLKKEKGEDFENIFSEKIATVKSLISENAALKFYNAGIMKYIETEMDQTPGKIFDEKLETPEVKFVKVDSLDDFFDQESQDRIIDLEGDVETLRAGMLQMGAEQMVTEGALYIACSMLANHCGCVSDIFENYGVDITCPENSTYPNSDKKKCTKCWHTNILEEAARVDEIENPCYQNFKNGQFGLVLDCVKGCEFAEDWDTCKYGKGWDEYALKIFPPQEGDLS